MLGPSPVERVRSGRLAHRSGTPVPGSCWKRRSCEPCCAWWCRICWSCWRKRRPGSSRPILSVSSEQNRCAGWCRACLPRCHADADDVGRRYGGRNFVGRGPGSRPRPSRRGRRSRPARAGDQHCPRRRVHLGPAGRRAPALSGARRERGLAHRGVDLFEYRLRRRQPVVGLQHAG